MPTHLRRCRTRRWPTSAAQPALAVRSSQHRAAIIVNDSSELRARLAELATDLAAPAWRTTPPRRRDPPRVAFVFTGQGAQYAGMGAGAVRRREPAFRAALDRCAGRSTATSIARCSACCLATTVPVCSTGTDTRSRRCSRVEVALAELWRGWGVTPTLVMGHSVGEIRSGLRRRRDVLDDAAALIAHAAA